MPFCTICGEKVEDDQKVCTNCGESLEKSEDKRKLESFFYVPIDFSDVKEVIPIGEDIIYSTLFSVFSHGMKSAGLSAVTRTQSYISHVLFTKNGIVYQEPKGGVIKPHYLPLYKIGMVTVGSMLIKKGGTVFTYMLHRHRDYESIKNFEMRHHKFFLEFAPRVINEKKENRYSKDLKKLEKFYNKMCQNLGEEGIEFLRTNDDYEAFKKLREEKLKQFFTSGPKWARYLVKKHI